MLTAEPLPPVRQGPRPVRASTTTGCCSSPRTGSRAFDVVLPTPIPDKGRVLTGLSRFWFDETRDDRAATTCSATDPADLPEDVAPPGDRRGAARAG